MKIIFHVFLGLTLLSSAASFASEASSNHLRRDHQAKPSMQHHDNYRQNAHQRETEKHRENNQRQDHRNNGQHHFDSDHHRPSERLPHSKHSRQALQHHKHRPFTDRHHSSRPHHVHHQKGRYVHGVGDRCWFESWHRGGGNVVPVHHQFCH